MATPWRVVVVGSVALDTVELEGGVHRDQLGGSAAFFSAAASLYTPTSLVAVVGADFPAEHVAFLRERGVDLAGLERAAGRTFRWHGRYSADLHHRETLETQLNVFEQFRPRLPPHYREAEMVFLGNIDPALQLEVLEQVRGPKLVAGDTMNLWIKTRRDALRAVLRRLDLLLVNEEEARMLSEKWHLVEAARAVQAMGPKHVLVKRGDAGALLFSPGEVFSIPAYPLDNVVDPTGAGDTFAGGLVGHLARERDLSIPSLRRAMAHATAVASFTVEGLSVTGLRRADAAALESRVEALRAMTHF